jgi:phosphoesterase RecJ-like protein
MNKILSCIETHTRILVVSHANPDGDAIGSLLAVGLSLDWLNKDVTMYNESPIPAIYRFLPSVKRVQNNLGAFTDYDVAIVLDCGDLSRIGSRFETIGHISNIINIDHHVTNTGFGDLQYIDHQACACAEIAYHLIQRLNIPVNTAIATSIYTGILTDTGSFRFANTNQAAFAICEKMISYGVDPYRVAQNVYGTYSLGRIKLLNLALDSIEISPSGKLSLMALTQKMLDDTGTQTEDIEGIINYARRIEDVKIAVLIQEQPNGNGMPPKKRPYHVSLRSDGTVDVAQIASAFGGGGHSSAAGFSVKSTLEDLKGKIFYLAENI